MDLTSVTLAEPPIPPTPSRKHWTAHLQSSNLYTFQKPVGGKRKYLASTIAIAVLSIVGAVGIDLLLNPNAITALFGSSSTGSTTNANGTKSATGNAIDYRYGTVQLKVTKTAGKIDSIDLVQAGATAGRDQAFSMLVDAAVKANGSSFGNVGGATYTTDAFKQALDSALSTLG
jgi:uncharacterized protein with FMN-binding domain